MGTAAEEARRVAESAREKKWSGDAFVRDLMNGTFRIGLGRRVNRYRRPLLCRSLRYRWRLAGADCKADDHQGKQCRYAR